MMISTPSSLLNTALATPEDTPLCQKPPSPITVTTRLSNIGPTADALARPRPYPSTVLPRWNGGNVPQVPQPLSAATRYPPVSRPRSFIAENTGRSGQPMQHPGGRLGPSS